MASASKSPAGIRTWWPPSPTRSSSERKYTSVVIAWAPDDRPTDAQIEAVLDEFEKTAWAGLEPERGPPGGIERRGGATLASANV